MTQKKDDELLRVKNLEKNTDSVAASVIDPPQDPMAEKRKKITFFTVLLSAFSRQVKDEDVCGKIRPVTTLRLLILTLIFGVCIYIFYWFVNIKIMVPLMILYCVLSFPLIILSLFYEINPGKKATIFQMLVAFASGMILYIAIDGLFNTLLVRSVSSYRTTIEVLMVPTLCGLGELCLMIFFSKIFNIEDHLSGILIAVCIGLGYAFTSSLSEFTLALSIPFDAIISEGEAPRPVTGIIADLNLLEKTFERILPETIVRTAVFNPFMLSSWSVVIGSVVPVSGDSKNIRRTQPFPAYFLVVLTIVLHMLSLFSSTLNTFSTIIKIITIGLTLYISLKIINGTLVQSLERYIGMPDTKRR